MTLQRSHDCAYPLVAPVDELPVGVPAPARPAEAGSPAPERGQRGQLAPGEGTRALARKAAQAKARKRADAKAWGAMLGLGRLLPLTPDEHLAGFVREAEAWLAAQAEAVARDVGGGQLSPGVVSILRTAAWERMYSAFLFDAGTRATFAWDSETAPDGKRRATGPRTDLIVVATRLGDSARQNLIAVHELASREAQARLSRGPAPGELPPGFEWVDAPEKKP